MKGHIRSRGRNRWEIAVYLGIDEDTKKKRYSWTKVRGKKSDAQRELRRLLEDADSGIPVRAKRTTVDQHLLQWISDSGVRSRVAPSTLWRYNDIVTRILVPEFRGIDLRRLSPELVQRTYASWLRAGTSAQTVIHYHRLLKRALAHGVRWRSISRNPIDLVDPPRVARREPAVLNEAQAVALFNALAGTRVQTAVLLAIATGMRRGEILALRWSDIDLDSPRAVVSVSRSLEGIGRELRFKETKSRSGVRQIPLPQFWIEALRRHKAKQNAIRLAKGALYVDNDLVCCCDDGSPWRPRNLTSSFIDALKARKLPNLRFHDLRHAYASWLLRQGAHPKVVSERLGHSSTGITMAIYAHVMPGLQDEATDRLNDAFSNTRLAGDWQNPKSAGHRGGRS